MNHHEQLDYLIKYADKCGWLELDRTPSARYPTRVRWLTQTGNMVVAELDKSLKINGTRISNDGT